MSIKPILVVFGLLLSSIVYSQNKQILFGFAEMPNTLMVNPGAETNFRYHGGIPALSGFSFNIGASEGKLADLFLNDEAPFNTKFENLTNKLTNRDFLSFNMQIDILNGGYRLNEKTYLSFGMYQEVDFIGYYPKDIVELLYYGNQPFINKTVHFSDLKFRGEVLGVIHAGLSYKLNKKLNVGGRFKLYSGSLHISSKNNGGTFNTDLGVNNVYRHNLSNINIKSNSSGFFDAEENLSVGIKDAIGNTFLSKNIGIGVDVGFTYHYSPQVEFTGSILDIGFISYSKNNSNLTVIGDHQFDGVNLLYDSNNSDYWAQLDRDFIAHIPRETNTDAYVSWRPIKLNGAVKYSFGRARINKECYDETYKEYYNNSVGLQLYAITRPLSTQVAATVFLEKSISENFHAKFTYTVDDFSMSNVGVGVSTQMGIFQMYGMIGNVFKLSDLTEAKTASLQFGFNLIFD
jgi:hypothetical protein